MCGTCGCGEHHHHHDHTHEHSHGHEHHHHPDEGIVINLEQIYFNVTTYWRSETGDISRLRTCSA